VLDSDALYRLGKAGFLAPVGAWRCVVPEEVYTETVVRGLQEGHPDAEAIAALFGRGLIPRRARRKRSVPWLGRGLCAGERAAAALLLQAHADFVVTDDRAFLKRCGRRVCSTSSRRWPWWNLRGRACWLSKMPQRVSSGCGP
jgi:hypothetical protein